MLEESAGPVLWISRQVNGRGPKEPTGAIPTDHDRKLRPTSRSAKSHGMMQRLMQSGPASVCRLRLNGNMRRGADSRRKNIHGAMTCARTENRQRTGGRVIFPIIIQVKMVSLGARPSKAFRQTAMGSTTSRATSGNGALIGTWMTIM